MSEATASRPFPLPDPSAPEPAPAIHVDESNYIEEHAQTSHKLRVLRRYYRAYGNILLNSNIPNPYDLFFIDTHAGAGLHGSREHPLGYLYGSPLIACFEGRTLQRRNAKATVHVRAVDEDAHWVMSLQQRVDERFAAAIKARDRIDVRIYNGDYKRYLMEFLGEAGSVRAPSLWLIDPFGPTGIPFDVISRLQEPDYGPEVIINLDLTGLWRIHGQVWSKVGAHGEPTWQELQMDRRAQEILGELFGGYTWQLVTSPDLPFYENMKRLAQGYADRFDRFQYRTPHRLNSSRGQYRVLIHLTHVPVARDRFAEAVQKSGEVGLFAKGLDEIGKAHAAAKLFDLYRDSSTPLQQLHEEGTLGEFTKSELAAICRAADEESYGTFDEDELTMHWFTQRGEQQQTLF